VRKNISISAVLALLAGFALRTVFLAHHARFGGDALTYGDLAHNLLYHHTFGFTEDHIRPTLIRLPGYPLFLAACFALFGDANYLAVLWVQVFLDLITCILLAVLAAHLFNRSVGMAVLWLAALCPFTANYAATPLTETLSLLCVALAFFALERWHNTSRVRWTVTLGLALAYAVLLRPDQGILAAAVLPVLLWMSLRDPNQLFLKRLQPTALATAILVLPLLLWGVRNERTMHVFQPLAPRYANDPGEGVPYGFQRWYRTWAIDFKATVDIYWNYDGNPLRLDDLPPRAFDDAQQLAQTRTLFAQYNEETASTPAFDAAFAHIAAERIAAHPLRYYFVLPFARDLNMWLRPRTELMKLPIDWWAFRLHPKRSLFEIAYALLNAAYLALAAIGALRWLKRGANPIAPAMLAFVALRFLLLLTLDNSEPRYTLEAFPFIILLAGVAVLKGRASVPPLTSP
jgi:4-amino-4-deoxy-L-arabinose transferase-like glycosyltransferase